MNEPKPGYKTTEFWLTVLTNVAAIAATVADVLPANQSAIIMAAVNAFYSITRGMAKKQ